jgi:DNA modification methylase
MIDLKHGDCLIEMNNITDGSVDMISTDLPYGSTACKWDIIIPFEPLWEQYKRIIKKNGAIVLFAGQPFTSKLICSNLEMYKYNYIWNKTMSCNAMLSSKQPLKITEDIIVFYDKFPTYNIQKAIKLHSTLKQKVYIPKTITRNNGKPKYVLKEKQTKSFTWVTKSNPNELFPTNILTFIRDQKPIHPTQKPVPLLEYLIRTYTNEGETVLDSCMGSGTCGIAAVNLGRNFIGIEKEEKYFKIAKKRILVSKQFEWKVS